MAGMQSGCAVYGDWVADLEQQIVRGAPDEALQILAKRRLPSRDAVLEHLNKGMLLRMDGRFAASNSAFEAAKRLMDALEATSLHEQAGALTINDSMRSYIGDPYERVLLHVYVALNYLDLGDLDGARVEALQLDVRLNQLADDGYPEDAFARYFTGMIYEALQEWDDAMIAYRRAYEAYRVYPPALAMPVPDFLRHDLLRLTRRLGMHAEQQQYLQQFSWQPPVPDTGQRDNGELIFLLHSGLAPVKREAASGAVTESGQAVTIALPYYVPRRPTIRAARLRINDAATTTELVENVNTLAIASLDKQQPAILARAIARAALKSKAVRETRKNDEALGFIVNVAGVVTERADTRSWSTLPSQIDVARLMLPPGHYDLAVELLDRNGDIVQRKAYNAVEIRAGKKHFISLRQVVAEDLFVPGPGSQRRHYH